MDANRINRRQFIRSFLGACILGVGGAARTTLAAPSPSSRKIASSLSSPLHKELFLSLLGESFAVKSPGAKRFQMLLTLVDIQDIHDTPETEQFSLVFNGPYSTLISEDVYVLRHRKVGRLRLLLQPGGFDKASSYYRAPFNLLR